MNMTSIIIAALIGVLVGGGAVGGIVLSKKPETPVVVADVSAQKQAEVQVQLSDLDIVKPVCTGEYIEKHGDGLCREMFCLAQSNSTTGGAQATTCDAIANVNNTKTMLAACDAHTEDRRREECFTRFRERK
jgi:hypothetical protein